MINLTNITTKEVNISKHDGRFTIMLTATLEKDDGTPYITKNMTLQDEDFTDPQKDKLEQILSAIITKAKAKEGI